ncbi:MAG: carboxylate--amine ligase [Haloferacaceae archaeon]
MADRFRSFDGLLDALDASTFDRPPAVVCNAHITALGVARALPDDVPVIALDREPDGVAPYSESVALAGRVTSPLDDAAGFRADVAAVAARLDDDPVAFPCMDEWVHALAPGVDGVRLPFAADRIDAVLDKVALYRVAEDCDVPHPETYRVRETTPDDAAPDRAPAVRSADAAADALGFPLVVKPALKRRFAAALGTNVIEVEDGEAYAAVVADARDSGVRIMAQERIPPAGADRSFVSYVSRDGDVTGVVGAPTRYPPAYGTSCLVERVEDPTVEARARTVLDETGYHGISEAEFVYDEDRGEHVLLDVNTRPWKWIGLPVQAGANLPAAAYADAVGTRYDPGPVGDATWVYLRDYLALLASGRADGLSRERWASLASGAFADDPAFATAVYDPADPGPVAQLLATEFSERQYYCSC